MLSTPLTLGFGITGSFCTFQTILPVLEDLVQQSYRVIPILSPNAAAFDTRFFDHNEFKHKVEEITGNKCITTILEAEPIGPKALLDALILAPCTGNTLAKLAHGITDTPVLMAAKAHLRNLRPVLIFVSTNDGLGLNLTNIGTLLNTKHIYLVPFRQDNYIKKPNSLVSVPELLLPSLEAALCGKQLEPVLAQ